MANAEFSQGDNLYAYCENNYLNKLDPTGNSFLGVVTGILDVAGTIPVVQDVSDPVSAVVCLATGDYAGAGLALTGMIPGVGEAADIAKAARDVKSLVKSTEGAAHVAKEAEGEAKGGTYLLRDADGQVKRTGRTNDLDRREGEHARGNETKDLTFEVDRRTDKYNEQRGREEQIYNQHPGAKSENGGLNRNRPISDTNKNATTYRNAANNM